MDRGLSVQDAVSLAVPAHRGLCYPSPEVEPYVFEAGGSSAAPEAADSSEYLEAAAARVGLDCALLHNGWVPDAGEYYLRVGIGCCSASCSELGAGAPVAT